MVTIVQSPSDKKSYRRLTLPNGLSVLLIHDPAVAAGLKNDPTEDGAQGDDPDVSMSEAGEENESSSEGSEGSGDDEGSEGEGSSEEDEGGPGRGKKRGSSAAGPGGCKKAAAAMAVGVGSFSDPLEMQGLAHYLEHMLFMGSEKYPDENEYDAFLNDHGGGSNAYTELEYTNYHFDVAPAHLEGALDRLAQFFVKPLFLAGSLEREVQAVDSEFKGVLQSDHSRLAQLMCHTCRPGHIYNKFSWGNLLSLWEKPREAGLDVRQKIIDFYRQHYSAERMSLVLLGGQDLDTLQGWVDSSFGAIPRGTAGPPASFEGAGPPFEGRWLYLAPAVKEHHEVTVTFQLPCLKANYANKPEHYLSHLIGHEGPGSLLSALKARGWALELCAGISDDGYSVNTAAYLFTVNIVLTEAGLQAGPGYGLAPVGLLFQYIKLLLTTGPQEWVYDELRAISDMKFRFLEEEDSCDFVTRLAGNIPWSHWLKPQHLLVAYYLHEHWQPDKVTELLGLMHPTNNSYRIDLLTKSFSTLKQQLLQQQGHIDSATTTPAAAAAAANGTDSSTTAAAAAGEGSVSAVHEPWFDMDAVKWQLPDSLTGSWASADVSTDLALPPPNPFVPTDFTLKGTPAAAAADGDAAAAEEQQQQQKEIEGLPQWVLCKVGGQPGAINTLLATPPEMIVDKPGVRLWHKLAVRYGQPRLVSYWRLSSPVASHSARHSVLCALWLRLVEEAQAEDAYLADVSGLHWSSYPEGVSGLEVRMDGFNDKLHVLAHRVFKALATAQVKAVSFPAVHEELMRGYRNALLKPAHAANSLRLQLLSGGPSWSHDELAEALAGVTGVEEVQAFAAEFLSRCHLEALIMGNATAAEAATLCHDASTIINGTAAAAAAAADGATANGTAHHSTPGAAAGAAAAAGGGGLVLCAADRPVEVCVAVPPGVEVLHQVDARNSEEDNCCVEAYYQVGLSSEDLRLRVLTDLVEQVISEPLYDTLRTKQQLGYTVSSGARLTHGVTGFCVVVVSAAFDAATVEERIEAFLDDYQNNKLKVMNEEEFSRHKAALASNKLQTDMSLGQEGDRAWEQVFSNRYEFVSREQEAVLLQSITLQQLQDFFATHLSPASPTRRKLCVRVVPTCKQQQQEQRPSPPQEHVQHEFGVLHPQGERLQRGKQQDGQQASLLEADEGHQPPAAAAAGTAEAAPSGDTPKSKRVRRQQEDQQQEGLGGETGLKSVQRAPVQVVKDVKAFKAQAARFDPYKTVQPVLVQMQN